MNWDEHIGNLVAIAVLIALVALAIWLTVSFTPWLDGLPFNPWWLMAPVVITTFISVFLFELEWDSDNCWLALMAGAIFVALVAVYIALALRLTSWLDGLPFNLWWLMVPVTVVSLILAVLSGWGETFLWILAVPTVVLAIPPLIATSPLWGAAWWIYERRERRAKEQREKETREKLERVLKQLAASDADKREARQSFEEDLWPNLGLLPADELKEAFTQIAEASPSWGLDQVHRALFWQEGDEVKEDEKVQAASQAVLRERLAQPDRIFADLAQLMSRTDWDVEQRSGVLERVTQEFEHDGLGDICRVYALLQAARSLCDPPDYMSLLYSLGDKDWTWADEWLLEIFPGWPGWEAVSEAAREAPMWWPEEVRLPEMVSMMEIPTERDRTTAILNIAVRVLDKTTDLRYGKERHLNYSLVRDLEQARFKRDMIALVDRGAELFSISRDGLLYPELVTKLRDLIKVCELLRRSDRSGLVVIEQLAFYASALRVLQSILQGIESDITPPDGWFLRRIVERWLGIITDGIAKMEAKAELEVKLTGAEPAGPDYTVDLVLHNRASGLAEWVQVQFDPDRQLEAKGIHAQDGKAEIEFIRGGQSVTVRFRLSADQPGTFRLPFRIKYTDLEREGKVSDFADEVSFAVKEQSFTPLVPNPYIAGPPLKTGKMFFGREEIFEFVEQHLPAGEQENLIVLHGERRTGKTSILYQLQHRLPEPYIPILIDLQGAPKRTLDAFWHYLARRMSRVLRKRGFSIEKPERDAFSEDPLDYFCDHFLVQVYEVVQNKRPVLLIDEFDVLVSEVKEGNLPAVVLENLRSVMQHTPLCFIFAGTYDIEKLGEDRSSVLFNTPLWKRIELLDRATFEALVQEPVKGYFEYDDYALERIREMASGHPYFVQLLCHQLVNYRNKNHLNYLTVQDVNNVIRDVVGFGQVHLGYMWKGLSLEKKQFLVVVSELLETKGIAVLDDIRAALTEHSIHLDFEDALRELTAKAILEEKDGCYEFPIGLVRTWIYETKSLESLPVGGERG